MEQHAFKNVNNGLSIKISSYLETSCGHSLNLYLNIVHFSTPVVIRHLWWLETVVFLHWCIICAVPFIIFLLGIKYIFVDKNDKNVEII
jgi:hypothetical protein